MRRDLPAGLDHLLAGADDRVAADNHRLRAARPTTGNQLIAIALNKTDPVERYAEPRRQNLSEGRPVPLAVIQCACDDRHIPVWFEADAAHLASGRTSELEIVTNPAPAQFA